MAKYRRRQANLGRLGYRMLRLPVELVRRDVAIAVARIAAALFVTQVPKFRPGCARAELGCRHPSSLATTPQLSQAANA